MLQKCKIPVTGSFGRLSKGNATTSDATYQLSSAPVVLAKNIEDVWCYTIDNKRWEWYIKHEDGVYTGYNPDNQKFL